MHQGNNLIRLGIEREVPRVEDVDIRVRYVLAIPFRLADIKRGIVLAPEDQELRLGLLQPGLPFWVSIDIRSIVVEEITLNLSLPWRVQKCVLISPKIRVVELIATR